MFTLLGSATDTESVGLPYQYDMAAITAADPSEPPSAFGWAWKWYTLDEVDSKAVASYAVRLPRAYDQARGGAEAHALHHPRGHAAHPRVRRAAALAPLA